MSKTESKKVEKALGLGWYLAELDPCLSRRWGSTWERAEKPRIGQNGGSFHSSQTAVLYPHPWGADQASPEIFHGVLPYGDFTSELVFPLFLVGFKVLLLEAETGIKCSTALDILGP